MLVTCAHSGGRRATPGSRPNRGPSPRSQSQTADTIGCNPIRTIRSGGSCDQAFEASNDPA
eukprot:7646772-Alexandrium_andersonii.AAC.1